MDGDRFDSLLRSLSGSPSRRSALRLLAGLLIASPLALDIARLDALKKCKKLDDKDKRERCLKKARQHNATHAGGCTPTCTGRSCGDDGCGGSCGTCTGGRTCCGGSCVNTATDEAHCGACDAPCAEGLTCRNGACGCTQYGTACANDETCCSKNCVSGKCACPLGQTRCGPRCVNTATDEAHCGGCGENCPAGAVCRAGQCRAPCPANTFCPATRQVLDPGTCKCVCPPGTYACDNGPVEDEEVTGCCYHDEACVGGYCVAEVCRDGPAACITKWPAVKCLRADADCFCVTTTEQTIACVAQDRCATAPTCTSSTDCAMGSVCVDNGCCDQAVCLKTCTA